MKFQRYHSINNVDRQKYVDSILLYTNRNSEWVATNKIHGANYSYWYDGTEIKKAKRSSFLNDDSTFFNHNSFNYSDNVKLLFDDIITTTKEQNSIIPDRIVVFGELFGGKLYTS